MPLFEKIYEYFRYILRIYEPEEDKSKSLDIKY